jgi:rubredoxin
MSQSDPQALACQDSCGATVADEAAALHAGWTFLAISRRWRCPDCWRALAEIARTSQGTPA